MLRGAVLTINSNESIMKSKLLYFVAIIFALGFNACTSDSDDDPTDLTLGEIEWNVSNLPYPGPNFEYHAWLSSNGVNFSLGKVSETNGSPDQTIFSFRDLNTLGAASRFLVKMENY